MWRRTGEIIPRKSKGHLQLYKVVYQDGFGGIEAGYTVYGCHERNLYAFVFYILLDINYFLARDENYLSSFLNFLKLFPCFDKCIFLWMACVRYILGFIPAGTALNQHWFNVSCLLGMSLVCGDIQNAENYIRATI